MAARLVAVDTVGLTPEAAQRRRELEAIETLYRLVKEYGSARVSIWLTAAALRAGEKL